MVFENPSVQCFINASLQLIDDLDKNFLSSCVKECKKDVMNAVKRLFQTRDAKEREFFIDKYFHDKQEDAQEFLAKVLEDASPIFQGTLHKVKQITDCGSGINSVNRPPSFFLTVNNLGESLQESIHKEYIMITEVDKCFINYEITPSKDIIIHLSRFGFDVTGVKNQKKVVPDAVLRFGDDQFELKGCIVHHGKTIDSGHYTYITFTNGEADEVIDDHKVKKKSDDYIKNGYVYLYKKKGRGKDVKSKKELIEFFEKSSYINKDGVLRILKDEWFSDDSIDLWMEYLNDAYPNNYYFSSKFTSQMFNEWTLKEKQENLRKYYKDVNLTEKKYILFPYNINHNHWVLFVYTTSTKTLDFCDSLFSSDHKKKKNKEQEDQDKEHKKFFNVFANTIEAIIKLPVKHLINKVTIKQHDNINCGAYISWFSQLYSKDVERNKDGLVSLEIDIPRNYRLYIVNKLMEETIHKTIDRTKPKTLPSSPKSASTKDKVIDLTDGKRRRRRSARRRSTRKGKY